MFDDIKQNSSAGESNGKKTDQPPVNIPAEQPTGTTQGSVSSSQTKQEPEDIFAGTADIAPPPSSVDTSPSSSPPTSNQYLQTEESGRKKNAFVKFIVVVIGAAIVIGGGYGVYNFWQKRNLDKSLEKAQQQVIDNIDDNSTPAVSQENVKPGTDTDSDGLLDEEEVKLGTAVNNADTDGDGLLDREEVEVYQTDPLNPDTDSDGYLDGQEVRNGYNPKGEGRLFPQKPQTN